VRRRPVVLLLAILGALAVATGAAADNYGFTPVEPASPNAERISDAYNFVSIFTFGVFLVVFGLLGVFIFRYRNRGRPRDLDGPQIRGNTNLELLWTIVPVLVLVAIGSFVFYKLPGIKDVPPASASPGGERIEIRVEGHQFYWRFVYPNGVVSMDEFVVPVNRVARLEITAPENDVIHSWWVPALGGKLDAIPGKTNVNWFLGTRTGVFRGQCGEFCGLKHAEMRASAIVVSEDEYEEWLDRQARPEVLGRNSFEASCAKCHGLEGQGGYGPPLQNNAILDDDDAIRLVMTEGRNRMPPVASDWNDEQIDATIDYLQRTFGSDSGSGDEGDDGDQG
jgi:cytochrome c oxidase subunit 2